MDTKTERPRSAVSNDDANQRLVNELEETVRRHTVEDFSLLQKFAKELLSPTTLTTLIASFGLLGGYFVIGLWHFVLEFGLVLINIVFNAFLSVYSKHLTSTELQRVLELRLRAFGFGKKGRREILDKTCPNAATFVTVKRGRQWIRIPPNLLIFGDYVRISPGTKAPADIEPAEKRKSDQRKNGYRMGEPMQSDATRMYRVTKTPAVVQLDAIFEARRRQALSVEENSLGLQTDKRAFIPPNPPEGFQAGGYVGRPPSTFDAQVAKAAKFLQRVVLFSFSLSLALTIIRIGLLSSTLTAAELYYELIIRHAVLIISASPLSRPLFFRFCHAFGNSILLHEAKNPPKASEYELKSIRLTDSWSTIESSGEIERKDVLQRLDDHILAALTHRSINPSSLATSLDILLGIHDGVTHVIDPFTTLGNITVFCITDKHGILAENSPMLKYLLLIEPQEEQTEKKVRSPVSQLESPKSTDIKTGSSFCAPFVMSTRNNTIVGVEPWRVEIVDFIRDYSDKGNVVFEGDEPRAHLSNLKPIALNALLNTRCTCNSFHIRKIYNLPELHKAVENAWKHSSKHWSKVVIPSLKTSGRKAREHTSSLSDSSYDGVRKSPIAPLAFSNGADRKGMFEISKSNGISGQHLIAASETLAKSLRLTQRTDWMKKNINRLSSPDLDESKNACLCELAALVGLNVLSSRRRGRIVNRIKTTRLTIGHKKSSDEKKRSPKPESWNIRSISTAVSVLVGDKAEMKYEVKSKYARRERKQRLQPSLQLFSRGHPDLILHMSSEYWNGTDIKPVNPNLRNRLLEISEHWKNEALDCIAMAYSPVPPTIAAGFMPSKPREELNPRYHVEVQVAEGSHEGLSRPRLYRLPNGDEDKKSSEALRSEVLENQIFLGMAALGAQPKLDAPVFVELLMNSGIRFVYFSRATPRIGKAFASALGLFTDWNAHVSLKDKENKEEPPVEGISKLPCGVSAIRDHIREVDDVPLLVSLFTDCESLSMAEMIKIYQENGESVATLGSSFSVNKPIIHTQADLALALDPVPLNSCVYDNGPDDVKVLYASPLMLDLSKTITTIPSAFKFQSTTGLQDMFYLISVARRFLHNYTQVLAFFCASVLTIFVSVVLSNVAGAPLPLSVYHILWILWIIVPLLSTSIFLANTNMDSLQDHAFKNAEHLTDILRFSAYFFVRFAPHIAGLLGVVLTTLQLRYNDNAAIESEFYWSSESGAIIGSSPFESALASAQSLGAFFLVALLTTSSAGFLYRNESICESDIRSQNVWWFASCLALALQACISFGFSPRTFSELSPFYAVLVGGPVVVIMVDEMVKMHDRKQFTIFQKRSRLMFDTRLGMHSPK
ncbi:hypothetical protein AAMO2058_000588800 [Amorphochlora amoebiformis]